MTPIRLVIAAVLWLPLHIVGALVAAAGIVWHERQRIHWCPRTVLRGAGETIALMVPPEAWALAPAAAARLTARGRRRPRLHGPRPD